MGFDDTSQGAFNIYLICVATLTIALVVMEFYHSTHRAVTGLKYTIILANAIMIGLCIDQLSSGYNTILILTKDRKLITGIKINEDDSGLDIVDKNGENLHVPKNRIKKFKEQKVSTMPGNFKELLEVQEIADILAYMIKQTSPIIKTSMN